jgi:tetratricopeptide (TPR) repeat protein
LNAAIRPDILFPAYLSGFNLIESFYLAMPFLSWQTVVIGDPLCAPFRSHALTAQEIDRGIDATTETPFFLSERRVQALTAAGTKPQAAKLLLKAEMRLARQDRPGARQALEEATAIDDNAISGHFLLGTLYEQDSQWEAAIDRYRRVIARTPNAPAALNNLAYLLAVRRNAPAEGLPVARRAYEAGKGSAAVSDTLGWIYHLLGNDAEAEPLVTAAGAASSNPETSLHAAVVLRAVGKTRAAVQALERALALDKRLDQREDVQQLQLELGLRAR